MYIHAWLYRGSSFYRAQVGNPNQVMGQRPCTGADIDRLRDNTIAHEQKHFTEDKLYFETHDVQKQVEAAFAPIDASAILSGNLVQADVDRM